jgi:DNA-binding transcriptional regulator GbsR (MarR family)
METIYCFVSLFLCEVAEMLKNYSISLVASMISIFVLCVARENLCIVRKNLSIQKRKNLYNASKNLYNNVAKLERIVRSKKMDKKRHSCYDSFREQIEEYQDCVIGDKIQLGEDLRSTIDKIGENAKKIDRAYKSLLSIRSNSGCSKDEKSKIKEIEDAKHDFYENVEKVNQTLVPIFKE